MHIASVRGAYACAHQAILATPLARSVFTITWSHTNNNLNKQFIRTCTRSGNSDWATINMGNLSAAILLLSVAVAIVNCQSNAGKCSEQEIINYIVNNLDSTCASSLETAFAALASPQRDTQLQAVCTANCAGKLANWYESECEATYNASTIYYLCLGTSNTASLGDYCAYAVPPLFDSDAEYSNIFAACNNQGQCTDQCFNALQSFADRLGCCYQDIYNNTGYLLEAMKVGEITANDLAAVKSLASSPAWADCGVTPPSDCTDVPFDFPKGGSSKTLPQLQLFVVLMVVATAIGLL